MRTLLLICISAALGAVAIAKVDNPELLRRLEKNGKSLNKLVARAVRLADTVSRRKNERDQAETDAQNMLQRIERRNGKLVLIILIKINSKSVRGNIIFIYSLIYTI